MKIRKWFVALLCGVVCLSGCGGAGASDSYKGAAANYTNASSASKSATYEMAAEANYDEAGLWMEGEYNTQVAESGSTAGNTLSQSSASKRKLIKNVNMTIETQEFETLMKQIDARVKELGGYIEQAESYNGSNYSYRSKRYANMTIRVPQQKLDDFVGTVSDLANVVNRSDSANDVTLQYVDVQSHKESLQVEQKRLLELLERAEELDDIITLENRLTNIRYQIESMESTLRTFDDQVDYSTVWLKIDEVQVFTPVEEEEEVELSVWERMGTGFMESLSKVKNFFVELGVWIVIHLPYLVIFGIFVFVILLIVMKTDQKAKMQRAQALAPMQDGKSEWNPTLKGSAGAAGEGSANGSAPKAQTAADGKAETVTANGSDGTEGTSDGKGTKQGKK